MRMAEPARQQAVLEFLISKGFWADPVCGQRLRDRETGELVRDPETGRIQFGVLGEFAFFQAQQETETETDAYSMVPVVCYNCGHVMWFNTPMLPGREQ
jgi:hypothetical protein